MVTQCHLRLFVTGQTARSIKAVENLQRLCERYLPHGHEIEIVDVLQRPDLAEAEKVMATPTLIRKVPLPKRRIIGDLSDWSRVLSALGLERDEMSTQAADGTEV